MEREREKERGGEREREREREREGEKERGRERMKRNDDLIMNDVIGESPLGVWECLCVDDIRVCL